MLLSWCYSPFFTVNESSLECNSIEALDVNGQTLEEKRQLSWITGCSSQVTRQVGDKVKACVVDRS